MAEPTQVAACEQRSKLGCALKREMGMDDQDARQIAGVVLAAFDGQEELDDREIESDLRSVFYELEEHKLLAFRRETYRNDEGHKRRAFFWTICWDEVQPDEPGPGANEGADDNVYDDLPSDAWQRAVRA